MSGVPALPTVVVKAHKPYSPDDILDAAVTTSSTTTTSPTSAALIAAQYTSLQQGQSQPHRSFSTDSVPFVLSPLSTTTTAGIGASSPISPNVTRSGSSSQNVSSPKPSNDSNTSKDPISTTPVPSMIRTRTIHPQVHYIFEDDPLENEILDSIPKSRCITLDLDPKSGAIKNVESFLTDLQIMDIKLTPTQPSLPTTSSSSSSLNSLMNNTGGNTNTGQTNDHENNGANNPNLNLATRRVGSSGPSSLQSSMTTSISKLSRGAAHQTSGGGGENDTQKNAKSEEKHPSSTVNVKDWTLVIDALEVEDKDQDSDSDHLDQSMVSSLDTDVLPDDYLSHCDALLTSYRTRYLLKSTIAMQ
ncbi:hypothetical protein BGZ76_000496 [Entomortierella beljakovae]|nr:hypothetical protein BGZ76_000496 [Entomortierella beljakovae]